MNKQEKTWNSSFVLDGAKLTRLHEELSQRLGRVGTNVEFKFTTNTRKSVLATRSTIAEVMQLDNTRKDPITGLSIDGVAETNGTAVLRASVELRPLTSVSPQKNVRLSVSGDDPTLVNELFAAAYEQVERALVKPWGQMAALVGVVLIFFFILVVALGPPSRVSRSLLSREDVNELSTAAGAAQTVEAKIDFIFQVERRQIAEMARPSAWPEIGGHSQAGLLVVGGMIFIVFVLLLYLAIACYPASVFAWGDYGEYYASLINRRRGIWKFLLVSVAASLLVGLVGAFLQTWVRSGVR